MKRILLIVLLACASQAEAGLFKCQEASGSTSYQAMPCAEGAKVVKSEMADRARRKSDLPCDLANVNGAERKLAVYMLRSASRSSSSLRSGGTVDQEVTEFRRASVEAGNIPVPECMEHSREVVQKYLDFTAERLAALSNRRSFESANARSDNLRNEYLGALEDARREARGRATHLWAPKEKR
jgi:hypothetical protein